MHIPPPTSFTNVFANLEKTGVYSRINLVVPKDFVDLLMRTHPRPPGVVTTTCNLLIVKLINELHKRGINDHTNEQQLLEFVINTRLLLPGEDNSPRTDARGEGGSVQNSPTPRIVQPSETPSIPGGTSEGHSTDTGVKEQSSAVQQGSVNGGVSVRRGRSGTKK